MYPEFQLSEDNRAGFVIPIENEDPVSKMRDSETDSLAQRVLMYFYD